MGRLQSLLHIENDIDIMRKIYSVFFLTLLLLTGLSCDDQSHGEGLFENSDRIICAEVSYLFSDNQTEADSEDNIEEIGAFLFDEGKFVKEYIGSKQAHSKYEFRLDAMKGNLYVVANASLLRCQAAAQSPTARFSSSAKS